jgi:hypothetical protein
MAGNPDALARVRVRRTGKVAGTRTLIVLGSARGPLPNAGKWS